MRRHPRTKRRKFVQKMPHLIFTLDQLVFLRKATTIVEQMILTNKKPLPNRKFAFATVTQVQAKINQMITQGAWGVHIGFDFNEMIILRTAVWIFATGLDFAEPSPENEKLRKQCTVLNMLLASRQK